MRRSAAYVAVVAVTLVAALALAAPAGSANECDGLQVCVPIAGPWVVVPAATGTARRQVSWQLTCPRRHVVGGLDAELSQRAIDVSFLGRLGSPVNPGITTSRSVTFLGAYVGTSPRAPTFKPYVGCMPTQGGGSRVPTSATVVRAGHPDDLPREDHQSTAGKCLREHGLSRRRASRRSLARVRVLHEDSAGREPRLERQGRAVGSRRQGRRRVSAATPSSEESARSSRSRLCARGHGELPEPLAAVLARHPRGGGRPLAARRAAASPLRGAVHEHGRAGDGRIGKVVAEARAARAVRARPRASPRRARAAAGRADDAERARDGHPRRRHVPFDASERRGADAAGSGAGVRAHVSRHRAGQAARRPRRIRGRGAGRDPGRPATTISFARQWRRSTRS